MPAYITPESYYVTDYDRLDEDIDRDYFDEPVRVTLYVARHDADTENVFATYHPAGPVVDGTLDYDIRYRR